MGMMYINPKRILMWLAVFASGVLVGAGLVYYIHPQTTPSVIPVTVSPISPTPFFEFGSTAPTLVNNRVTKVVDGDTVELATGERVRYIGIDTPESVDPRKPVQCFAREAAERNKQLVLGKPVRLEKDISQTDRYGRLLRYVYVTNEAGEEVFINETLVREGYAFASSFPPDIKYQAVFKEAEREARDNKLGLWGSCPVNSGSVESSSTTTINSSSDTNIELKQETSTGQSQTGCVIKGNISSGGKIYHLPGCGSYDKTAIDESAGEHWFCSENEAEQAGWRKAKNC